MEKELIAAYKQGVEEAAVNPVVYIDAESDLSARDQLNQQVQGLGDNAVPGLVPMENLDFKDIPKDTINKFLDHKFEQLEANAPSAATYPLVYNGKEYAVVSLPPKKDLVEDGFITRFLKSTNLNDEEKAQVIENNPATEAEIIRAVGNHEGAHTTQHLLDSKHQLQQNIKIILERGQEPDKSDVAETMLLALESHADELTFHHAEQRGEDDLALYWRDLRAFIAAEDPGHASSALANSGDLVTGIHLSTANGLEIIKTIPFIGYDWDAHEGDATSAQELRSENPDLYFKTIRDYNNERIENILYLHERNPDLFETQKDLLQIQTQTTYLQNYEDAYRRQVLGEDIPVRAPAQIMSESAENEYVSNLALQDEINKIKDEVANSAEAMIKEALLEEDIDPEKLSDEEMKEKAISLMASFEKMSAKALKEYEESPNTETTGQIIYLKELLAAINSEFDEELISDIEGEKTVQAAYLTLDDMDIQNFYMETLRQREEKQAAENSESIKAEAETELEAPAEDNIEASDEITEPAPASEDLTIFDFSGDDSEFQGDNSMRINAVAALEQIGVQTGGLEDSGNAAVAIQNNHTISHNAPSM